MSQRTTNKGTAKVEKAAKDTLDEARATASGLASSVSEAVGAGRDAVRQKASDATATLRDSAGAAMETTKEAVAQRADAARDALSDAGDRLAKTLERTSADADRDALTSSVLSTLSQGLSSASDALRQRSVGDLTAEIRGLAQRHPGAFMAAAAVAGFAAARFVRSSAARQNAMRDAEAGRGPRV